MTENVIFCYSGTGNSLASANIISQMTGMTVVRISNDLAAKNLVINSDTCVIIFPSYAFGLPVTVKNFIKSTNFKVKYMALIATYGSCAGGAVAEAARLLKKQKQKTSYFGGIKAVENYVHIFGLPSQKKINAKTIKQEKVTEQTAKEIRAHYTNKRNLFTPLSSFVSGLFRLAKPLFAKSYKVTKDCDGCGFCSRICPSGAIGYSQKSYRKPVFNAKICDHCQACLQLCPQKALKYMRVTPNSGRYLNSGVRLGDMVIKEQALAEVADIDEEMLRPVMETYKEDTTIFGMDTNHEMFEEVADTED